MEKHNRKRQLLKMKLSATVLLVAMACLFIVSRLYGKAGIWEWIGAFSEAAMIGALADWFAVVAIFRHPLKLPIPRTAIIAENKDRIAENLAVFIRDNFLSRETMTAKMRDWEPAQRMAAWLSSREKADFLADKTIRVLTGALEFVDDQRVGKLLRNAIYKQLEELDLGNLIGQLMDVLTHNNQHQALFDVGLLRISSVLDEPGTRRQLAAVIIEVSRREYPKLIKMLGLVMDTDEFGMRVAGTLVESLQGWLHDIGRDPAHPRRKQFDELAGRFISRVKSDPGYHARIESWKRQFLGTPVVAEYFETLWVHFRHWIQKDAMDSGSEMKHRLSRTFRRFGRWILENPAMTESINDQMIQITQAMSEEIRSTVAQHIVYTVRNWDSRSMVRELELSIGKDLQFIRINGTLVGGVIGLLLHAVVVVIPM
ncbi:DUF445 domain-containing protein [Oxalobacter aliiformigenes]|uniref:DUF445 domain-containing protein n=1 Tax=Oxalobacter aliiformigenes TaxID=2946593 RepID=UPI0022B03C52|nr:DUF445 domain-containing protein [Oxalobacter aliiformigenes]WAV88475.1 DUF445 domain-containing protein [Oxalobacter aliiformigenes]